MKTKQTTVYGLLAMILERRNEMKNKQNIVYRVVGAVLLPLVITVAGLTLAGCPQEEGNEDSTITTSFGKITVKGNLNSGELDKIQVAFDAVFSSTTPDIKTGVSNKSVTVIVEKNPAYPNYSTTRHGNTMHINYAIVNNADALLNAIGTSCALLGGLSAPEIGKAIDSSRDTVRMSKAPVDPKGDAGVTGAQIV